MKPDMKHDGSCQSADIPAGLANVGWKHGERGSVLAFFFLLLAGAILALTPAPIFANGSQPPQMGALEMPTHDFYGLLRTRHMLEELRGQLHLRPKQTTLWESWFAGAMEDCQQQYEGKYRGRREPFVDIHEDNSTPERMEFVIGQLHVKTARMQERLRRMEAAQTRTAALYDVLDVEQKRVFDLFCKESFYTKIDQDLDEDHHGQAHRPPTT